MSVKVVEAMETRFQSAMLPGNVLAKLNAVDEKTKTVIKQVRQNFQIKRLGYHGTVPDDQQFEGQLTFSDDDGQSFVNPMPTPEGNRICQIRLSLTQFAADNRFSGFQVIWYLPTGWTWTDGLGSTTYEEVVSNPTTVTRVMRSPANPQPAAWRVVIGKRYL